jgi:transposase-like protein
MERAAGTAAMPGMGCITASVKSQYERRELAGGAVVYAFTGIPPHYACPHCFAHDMIQVLQYRRIGSGSFECLGCKTSFPIKQGPRKVCL